MIYHNFIGLLYTLEIMNGKYYINWNHILPINLLNFKQKKIYLSTTFSVQFY